MDRIDEALCRTALLYGPEAVKTLARRRVAVFGLGGVGGYALEALARSGIGTLDVVDNDRLCESNLNRQILATRQALGQWKVEAARDRVRAIRPETTVHTHACFFLPETADAFDFRAFDYVVDAIDTVRGKLEIVTRAWAAGVPVISCMGAGNKLDPTRFRVADINDTRVCPLARVMRTELRKRGIPSLKVVYSDEPPRKPWEDEAPGQAPPEARTSEAEPDQAARRAVPASNAFVPAVAGLVLAGEVINDLAGFRIHP